MSMKQLWSMSLLIFILQACGDTPNEKKLKQRNAELSRQNTEMVNEKDQSLSERDAARMELIRAQDELAAARKDLNQATDAKLAGENAKLKLEAELAVRQKTAKELNKKIEDKDKLIFEKEGQIKALRDSISAGNPELTNLVVNLQAEINQLQVERSNLETAMAQSEAATAAALNELQNAQSKLAILEARILQILQKSLADVRGLWLNQDEVTAIADSACYEFVHVGNDGSFAQALACRDGRIQMQKHSFDRFSAAAVPDQSANEYVGAYGFVIDGTALSSTCQNPDNSIQKIGQRLVFEMTRQDFGRDYGALISKNMVLSLGQDFKGFSNAALNFVSNKLDYAPMAAIANVAGASDLAKAAATFIGALQSQGTAISLGCFDSNGAFTAAPAN